MLAIYHAYKSSLCVYLSVVTYVKWRVVCIHALTNSKKDVFALFDELVFVIGYILLITEVIIS